MMLKIALGTVGCFTQCPDCRVLNQLRLAGRSASVQAMKHNVKHVACQTGSNGAEGCSESRKYNKSGINLSMLVADVQLTLLQRFYLLPDTGRNIEQMFAWEA